jgi:ferredoxin
MPNRTGGSNTICEAKTALDLPPPPFVQCPLLNDHAGRIAWCCRRIISKERLMPYIITDKCTMCGGCKDSCPAEAINEGDPKFVIDADTCIDCGACVDTCGAEAIEEA